MDIHKATQTVADITQILLAPAGVLGVYFGYLQVTDQHIAPWVPF